MANTTDTTKEAQINEPSVKSADELNADSNATVLDAEIHGDTFEIPLRHLEGVVDDARIQFDENGMYAKAVESDNVAMARVFIPKTMFADYDLVKPGIDGVDVKHFGSTLRSMKTRKRDSDLLELSIGHTYEGDKLFFTADSQGTTEGIDTLDADSVRRPPTIPDLTFAADVLIEDGNELREWIKSLKTGVVTVAVSSRTENDLSNATLTFENRKASAEKVQEPLVVDEIDLEQWGNATAKPLPFEEHNDDVIDAHCETGVENMAHVRSNYSVDYWKMWAKRLRKTRTEGVPYRLKFGDEWPLKLIREDETDAVAEYMLAPRIDMA